ncbi:unnamed protein product [Arctogadus glacialis]
MWYKAREPSTVVPSPAEGEHSGKEVLSGGAEEGERSGTEVLSIAGPQEPHAGVHPGGWSEQGSDGLRFIQSICELFSICISMGDGVGGGRRLITGSSVLYRSVQSLDGCVVVALQNEYRVKDSRQCSAIPNRLNTTHVILLNDKIASL